MQYCSVRANLLLLTLLRFHGFCVNAAVLLWALSNSQLLLSWIWALYINCRVKFWPQRQNSTNCWLLLTILLCIPNGSLEDLPTVPPFLKCPTQKIASWQGSLTPFFWPLFCWADRAQSHPACQDSHPPHTSLHAAAFSWPGGAQQTGPCEKSLKQMVLPFYSVAGKSQSHCWEHLSTPFPATGSLNCSVITFLSEKGLLLGHNSRRDVRAAKPTAVPADLLMQLSAKCASFCDSPCNPSSWFIPAGS